MADHLAAPTPLEEHRKLAVFAGEWNGEEMKATNCPEAAQYVKPEFRKGWEI